VQGIVRELSGERIDIVPYSEDPIAFVTKALSPAKILQVIPDEANKTMQVVVTEDQLSLAIGKGGQNARLAAKLTGWKIDLVSETEFAVQRGETSRAQSVPVEELSGLGPKTIENLVRAGFETVQDIVKASIEDLINVPGVGDVTAQKIYLAAVQHLEAVEETRKREAEAAKEVAAAKAAAAAAPREEFSLPPAAIAVEAPRIVEEVAEREPAKSAVREPEPEAEPEPAAPVATEKREAVAEPAVPLIPTPKTKSEEPGKYLDDIAAMESELSSGWEADADGEDKERS
jgi:N utilization substance protein A